MNILKGKFTKEQFEAHCAGVNRATTFNAKEAAADKSGRIGKLLTDYKLFFDYYFPHYAKSPTASFHLRLAKALKANKGFRGFFKAFRGAAKSVHTNIGLPIWLMMDHELLCMLLVSDNETKACRLLAALQAEFENNQRLINDFGKQVTHGDWSKGEFVTKMGAAFYAIGLGQVPTVPATCRTGPITLLPMIATQRSAVKTPCWYASD